MVFTEPIAQDFASAEFSLSNLLMVVNSVRSPVAVPVPWASYIPTVLGLKPAF